MKKLFALLLAICLLVGLVGCGQKPAENTPTTATTPTVGDTSFKGKTLQLWGMGTETSYTDYETFGKGNYLWMMKAAIDEWAAVNGVTIKYAGSYNQNAILAAMASGEKPDIIFQTNNFPVVANFGIVQPWTEEEYNTLVEISGNKGYMDLLNYKGKSYGFVYPWSGNIMCYYNKSMFERYDVKSPLDYYKEGAWNWDNFMKCMDAMTRDLDGDGTFDTIGLPADSIASLVNPNSMDVKGNLLNVIDEPWFQEYAELRYQILAIKKTAAGKNNIQKNVTYPMAAMQLSDCEPYNFEHMFQVMPNGDELVCVPMPIWEGDNGAKKEWLKWTTSCAHMAASVDEREAAFDLLCYLMKCGLKYISDFSLGAVKCDHAGIQGSSELSKKWKDAFAKVVEDRQAAVKELEFYDASHMTSVTDYFKTLDDWYCYQTFTGVSQLSTYAEFAKMPAASAIPAVKEKYQAALDKYNDLYVYED